MKKKSENIIPEQESEIPLLPLAMGQEQGAGQLYLPGTLGDYRQLLPGIKPHRQQGLLFCRVPDSEDPVEHQQEGSSAPL